MFATPIVLGGVALVEARIARERVAGNLASQFRRLREVRQSPPDPHSTTELDSLAAALLPAELIENGEELEGITHRRITDSRADELRARLVNPKGIE